MRALAWDDKPEEYLNKLKIYLEEIKELRIEVVCVKDFNDIVTMMRNEKWDFLITDNLDEVSAVSGEEIPRGVRLAQMAIDQGLPAYVVTHNPLHPSLDPIRDNVYICWKGQAESFVAYDIERDLRRRGVPNRDQVFLIYGHDVESDGMSKTVEHEMKKWGLTTAVP